MGVGIGSGREFDGGWGGIVGRVFVPLYVFVRKVLRGFGPLMTFKTLIQVGPCVGGPPRPKPYLSRS